MHYVKFIILLASTSIAKFSTVTTSTPSHISKIHSNSSSTFLVSLPTSKPIVKNITTTLACPVGQILGHYWPNWQTQFQPPSKINLNQSDLVFYFGESLHLLLISRKLNEPSI